MKLIWHIIWKDVVRQRWLAASLLALYLLQMGAGLLMLNIDGGDGDAFSTSFQRTLPLAGLQLAMGFLLVIRLVQEDGLVGTQSFWQTRPVSGLRLLTAKLMVALLLLAGLPTLICLPWWLLCGFGVREIFFAGCDLLCWQILLMAPAFLIGAITDTLGRALMWSLVFLTGAWVIAMKLSTQPAELDGVSLIPTRLLGALIIGLLLCGGVTLLQYHTRRLIRSVTITMLGVIAAVLVLFYWPWHAGDLMPGASSRDTEPALATGGGPIIQYDKATIRKIDASSKSTGIEVFYRAHGIPPERGVLGQSGKQTWSWPDGRTLTRLSVHPLGYAGNWVPDLRAILSLPEPLDDPETRHWWDERNAKRGAKTTQRWFLFKSYTSIPTPIAERIISEPPVYRVSFQAALTAGEVIAEIPLFDDKRHYFQGRTLRLFPVTRLTKDVREIRLVATQPTKMAVGQFLAWVFHRSAGSWIGDAWFLVNKSTGDFARYMGGGPSARVLGVTILYRGGFPLNAPKVVRDGKWVPRYPDWFTGVDFVVLKVSTAGEIRRALKVEAFALKSPVNEPAPESKE